MKRQSIRKLLFIISMLLFPVTMWYISPYIIIQGASVGIITGSFVAFLLMLFGSVFFGKVTKYETTENGRKKIIYTVTGDGRKCLRDWLSVPVTRDELRYETLLKLFFGSEAGLEVTLNHIENFEDKIKGELPILEGAVRELQKIQFEDTHRYYF